MIPYVQFSGTREEAERLVRSLPAVVAGRVPDVYGLGRGIQLRGGVALLSEVQQDFLVKSRGGRGRDGIEWPPLQPETIARRRSTKAERRGLGIREGRARPSLTPAQDARWSAIFVRTWQLLRMDMDDKEAKARAGAAAWAAVKAAGAKTVKDLLGSRQVDMLRDTGELLRSLTPGVEDKPSGADGQVFLIAPGRVTVGSNKKPWHHRGDPARHLPKRLLWPEDGTIPDPWWPGINEAVVTGYLEAIATVMQRAHV